MATIKPEFHLLKVGFKMFRRKPMPSSDDAALQQTEGALNRVRVHISINIYLRLVLNGFVALCESSLLHCGRIGVVFISHDHIYVFADILFDVLSQSATLYIVGVEEPNVSAALPKPN